VLLVGFLMRVVGCLVGGDGVVLPSAVARPVGCCQWAVGVSRY
jgi:hypothetical protein